MSRKIRKPRTRSGYAAETLEPRTLLTVNVLGTDGNDTITLSLNSQTQTVVATVNGNSSTVGSFNSLDTVVVDGLGGNDTIRVNAALDGVLQVFGGSGDDTIFLGGGDLRSFIRGDCTVQGGSGVDNLILDDSADPGLTFPQLAGAAAPFSSEFNQHFGNLAPSIIMDNTIQNFTLRCGSGNDQALVEASVGMGFSSITIDGNGGNDSMDITNSGESTTFNFDGGTGTNSLNYEQFPPLGSTYTIATHSIDYGPGMVTFQNTQSAEVFEGSVFNVNGVASGTAMTLDGVNGSDTFNVGNFDMNANILGRLTLKGSLNQSATPNSVFFSDGLAATGGTYTVRDGASSFTKTGFTGRIDTVNIGKYTLTASSTASDTITAVLSGSNVNVDGSGADWLLHGGAGDDTFTLSDGALTSLGNAIRGIPGNVTVTGSGGNDSLTVNDTATDDPLVTRKDYAVTFGLIHAEVNGADDNNVNYSGIETATINAGSLPNVFTVGQILLGQNTLTLNGGDGDDEVVYRPSATASAVTNFNGGNGTNSVLIDDQTGTATTTYTLNRQSFTSTNAGTLDFNSVGSASLFGNAGPDTIDVRGTAPGVIVSVSGGAGDDTVIFGNHDLDTNLAGNLSIDGGAGSDTMILDDSGDTQNDGYQFATGPGIGTAVFTKTSMIATLTYTTLESIELDANSGANTITVASPGSATSVTVRGGAGADTFVVAASNTATISIDGQDPTAAPGDVLQINVLPGSDPARLTPNGTGGGTYSFAFAKPITFAGIESFPAAPPAPSQPDLILAADTGISQTDNLTRAHSPSFTGTSVPGSRISLIANGLLVGAGTAAADGTYQISVTLQADGVYSVVAQAQDPLLLLKSQLSSPLVVTIDSVPPAVTDAGFDFQTGHALHFTFSKDVAATLAPADLVLQNLTTGATIPPSALSLTYVPNTASFAVPGLLPDGDYTAKFATGAVTDAAGNALPAIVVLNFFVLNADVNRDRSVGFPDLLVLAQHFNQRGNFAAGDVNYDGTVNFNDLLLVAQNFGRSMPAPAAAAFAPMEGADGIQLSPIAARRKLKR